MSCFVENRSFTKGFIILILIIAKQMYLAVNPVEETRFYLNCSRENYFQKRKHFTNLFTEYF